MALGKIEVPIRATIAAEPDKLTERLTVGPARAGFARHHARNRPDRSRQPGQLALCAEARATPRASRTPASSAFRERIKQALPEGGFTVRDRRDPSPQVSRTLERLRQFLTLVGLTALLVGGVGVANAVATYIDRRRKVIAAFKSLGATSRMICGMHLLQVMMIAGIGIVLGIGAGLADPRRARRPLVGDALPIKAELTVSAAQPADGGRLRLAGVAAVHAVAARARRAGARRRAVPRRGGAGARAAAPAHHRR